MRKMRNMLAPKRKLQPWLCMMIVIQLSLRQKSVGSWHIIPRTIKQGINRQLLSPPRYIPCGRNTNPCLRSTTALMYTVETGMQNATAPFVTAPTATLIKEAQTLSQTKTPLPPSFEVTSAYLPTGDQPEAIDRLVEQVQRGDKYSVLRGITGTGKTFVMAHTLARCNRPALILCHNKTLAAQLARELRSLLQKNQVHLFVSYYNHYVPESYNEKIGKFTSKKSSISKELNALRHLTTRALVEHSDTVIVASISCIYGLGLPASYLDSAFTWEVGGGAQYSEEEIIGMLQGGMYTSKENEDNEWLELSDTTSLEHGEYHMSRSSIDGALSVILWPPTEPSAIRVHFNVTKTNKENLSYSIGSIDTICPNDDDNTFRMESVTIFPARHHSTGSDEERFEESLSRIQEELSNQVKNFNAESKFVEADRLSRRVSEDLMLLRETRNCNGIENYSRHLALRNEGAAPDTLLDYFGSQNFLLFVDESHVALPQLAAMYRGDKARKKMLVKHGYRLPSALDNRPLKEDEFWDRVTQTVFVSATPSKKELDLISNIHENTPIDMTIRPTFVCDPPIDIRPTGNQLEDLVAEVKKRIERKERSLAMTLTKRDAEDLSSFLIEQGIPSTYIHSGLKTRERSDALKSLQLGKIDCLVGVNLLREGLDLPEVSLVAILNADVEGFLRSETALLQTIGRAARNQNGRAILYADRITDSMEKCVSSTRRRREIQLAYNKENCKEVRSAKGSSFLPIFDLLSDKIKEETALDEESSTSEPMTASAAGYRKGESTVHVLRNMDLNRLPKKPGVYFWKDRDSNILYIGKAKQLRQRIMSYVRPRAKHGSRIKAMLAKSETVDFLITPSERDALLLEANLINRHKPPYNVLLKDDQSYPYICASVGDELPEFRMVPRRQVYGDAGTYRYFGPYPDYSDITAILEGIEETYGLRSMRFKARFGDFDKEAYQARFDEAFREVFQTSEGSPMVPLSNMRLKGEEASIIFDSAYNKSRDVVVVVESDLLLNEIIVLVLQLRQGIVIGSFSYIFEFGKGHIMDRDLSEAIEAVLIERHYRSGEAPLRAGYSFFPDEILVQHPIRNLKELKDVIKLSRDSVEVERKDAKISVRKPAVSGSKKKVDARVIEFALQNAKQVARERETRRHGDALLTSVDGTAATELASLLSLEAKPEKIECFDISHLQGEAAVGSRVVFNNGRPQPHLYRRFNVNTVADTRDDYANLEEVLARRFLRARSVNSFDPVDKDDPWAVPDVVVIDGGKGQLAAALRGMAKARVFPSNLYSNETMYKDVESSSCLKNNIPPVFVPVIALAKRNEELFEPGSRYSINAKPDSPALLLLRALRDESHRFAVSSHKKRRSNMNKL
ncbi:unnamed protein product [Pseudo-nitzschia multistriata]|uniref:Excinuclease ABC subunit B n=1 Tax=Pseudo-nitzschia multistriata TaxID=183589 RepID=A0A448ZH66_9STRA|nr:unnamed protein product [Pseudo-nitzschia multistriata]